MSAKSRVSARSKRAGLCGRRGLRGEGRADQAGGSRLPGWGVQSEVDEQVVVGVDDEPAECCLVSDPLGAPALVARCRLEGVPGGGNIAAAEVGEEVEVLGGPGGQVLRDQGRAAGQKEPEAAGREKKS
jgi:hypothetical protein